MPDEYNGYRSLDVIKAAVLIHFICTLTDAFRTKLNKLLFYIDFDHYRNNGISITGLQYCAIPWGPVPNRFSLLYDHLVQLNYIKSEYYLFPNGYEGEKYLPGDISDKYRIHLAETEVRSVEGVIRKIGSLSSVKITELSHQEIGWIENRSENAKISYEYSFDLLAI
jgi:hypothetical protein